MKITPEQRETIIAALIEHWFNEIVDYPDGMQNWFENMMRTGRDGYDTHTDDELREAVALAGLDHLIPDEST